jgi:hypothetical protein
MFSVLLLGFFPSSFRVSESALPLSPYPRKRGQAPGPGKVEGVNNEMDGMITVTHRLFQVWG